MVQAISTIISAEGMICHVIPGLKDIQPQLKPSNLHLILIIPRNTHGKKEIARVEILPRRY